MRMFGTRHSILCGAVALTLASGAALAVDGVVLIDQNKALAGNVTPGDAPGFPVTISVRGSYRLSSNLTVPNAATTGIEVSADSVTIDLNGFAIIGPVTCTGGGFNEPDVACSENGAGRGIQAASGLTVTNGTVRGMGSFGILAGENCRIDKVHLVSNAANGLSSLNGCVVTDSMAMRNGSNGFFGQSGTFSGNTAFANAGTGFTCSNTCQISKGVASFNGIGIGAGGGSSVANNSLFSNRTTGISGSSATVIGNTVLGSGGFGIFCQSCMVKDNLVRSSTGVGLIGGGTGYASNVFQNNNGGDANQQIAPGAGSLNLGQNQCAAAPCP